MCGIYGMLSREGPANADDLGRMDRALTHRGPDDTGVLLDGSCGLGMRRLSIIDPEGGHQPIASEDNTRFVVMNGEIFNYRALRRELQERGHQLATRSDTEVLVHLYEERGPGFVSSLVGMFAFAIWDRRERTLVLGRDRLGIKPLAYADTPRALLFASEVTALLAWPGLPRALDGAALSHYLSFGTAPVDRGMVAGVRKLAPGHLLVVHDGRVEEPRRWWSLQPGSTPARTEAEGVELVRGLLVEAVESQLVADVPVGAFLSGGLDSSTVVAAMARAGARPRTFSIGFGERDFDELAHARRVAAHLGTEHEELVVRPEVLAMADDLVDRLDEPLGDVSAIPTWMVSALAARRVKVVLSGDGGDEVFAGYDHHEGALREARLDRLPAALRGALGGVARRLPYGAFGRRYLRHLGLPPRLRFVDGEALFQADEKERLLGDAARALVDGAGQPDALEERARLLAAAPGDALARLLWLDATTYLPLDILAKVDRTSMACSLEVRPPLLDHRLVEAVAAMPSSWKLGRGERKRLLRQAAAPWLPPETLARRKQGFGVPLVHWLRGPLGSVVAEVIAGPRARARGLFEPGFVAALLDEHRRGRRDRSLQLWALFVLERWIERVLEGGARAATGRAAAEAAHG